jgi:hypothetical protein
MSRCKNIKSARPGSTTVADETNKNNSNAVLCELNWKKGEKIVLEFLKMRIDVAKTRKWYMIFWSVYF